MIPCVVWIVSSTAVEIDHDLRAPQKSAEKVIASLASGSRFGTKRTSDANSEGELSRTSDEVPARKTPPGDMRRCSAGCREGIGLDQLASSFDRVTHENARPDRRVKSGRPRFLFRAVPNVWCGLANPRASAGSAPNEFSGLGAATSARQEEHDREDDADDEEDPRDVRRHARDAGEAEQRRNHRDDEKDRCPIDHGNLLSTCDGTPIDRRRRAAPSSKAAMRRVDGTSPTTVVLYKSAHDSCLVAIRRSHGCDGARIARSLDPVAAIASAPSTPTERAMNVFQRDGAGDSNDMAGGPREPTTPPAPRPDVPSRPAERPAGRPYETPAVPPETADVPLPDSPDAPQSGAPGCAA